MDLVREGGINEIDEKRRGKEGHSCVVIISGREEIRSSGEGIRSSKEFAGDMDHLRLKSARSISHHAWR